LELRAKLQSDEIRVAELYFNTSFLNELGHSNETFSNMLIKEGFPEY